MEALLRRPERDSRWSRFCQSPVKFVARLVYNYYARTNLTYQDNQSTVRIVCISDTHNTQPKLPEGDILIHAGDLTQSGTREELEEQIEWLHRQPHPYKIVIGGNHELCLDHQFPNSRRTRQKLQTDGKGYEFKDFSPPIDWKSLTYLQNSSTSLRINKSRLLKVFGSPYTPKYGNWAFQYPRSNLKVWEEFQIPDDTDILVTHGPPKAHLDLGHLGCQSLLTQLWSMKQKPKLHVFGHIHGAYGKEVLVWDSFQRAYEGIMNNQHKWTNLAKLLSSGLAKLFAVKGYEVKQRTIMVNAAAVGGVREGARREAICVDI